MNRSTISVLIEANFLLLLKDQKNKVLVVYFTESSLLRSELKVSDLVLVYDKLIKTKLSKFSDFIIFKYFVNDHQCWDY